MMKVFLAVASFLPSYGGPARSVSRLAGALADAGLEVGVWAPDQSALDTDFVATDSGVRRLQGNAALALEQFGRPDVIHDNGIWLPHNHRLAGLARKQAIPRVVSTRGMLDPWALSHKRWKKRLAWCLYQKRDLRSASALLTTAPREATRVEGLGLGLPVHLAPNGVDLPQEVPARPEEQGGVRYALFLGRMHSVKGLPMLVDAWARVRPSGWRMRVVGPEEDGHRAEVEAMVQRAGLASEWDFEGGLEGSAKRQAFREASLFILPTHSENFGLAVAEALAHDLPVITTKGAPWEGLVTEDCGWWTEVTVEGLCRALKEACNRSAKELRQMGGRGRQWMERDFSWASVGQGIQRVYESVL